jgi:hypothetical protein
MPGKHRRQAIAMAQRWWRWQPGSNQDFFAIFASFQSATSMACSQIPFATEKEFSNG